MAEVEKVSGMRALWRAMRSWRTASVTLLAFSSGMPLGLIWIAVPDWMRSVGVDIRIVGLLTLAQAPWTFKFLWSPLMDRYAPPFWGRRRGWMAIAQVVLFALGLCLAGLGDHPDTPWVVAAVAFAIAFAAASQDIAYDAYTVDVLRPEEQGVAAGAKVAVYRAAMFLAGGSAISLAGRFGWQTVNIGLACLYLPMVLLTWRAPEPQEKPIAPRTLRDAVWLPFLGFLGRHRALEILAFVICYKFADNLAQALLRPFLIDLGYSADDRGVALATISTATTLAGAFLGGALTTLMGLGPALWVFGALQIFSNVGYVLLVDAGINRPLMYGAMGFESLTQGLGTGAFSVLLLRLTQKRFSATQYALFSSLFGVSRLLTGPIAGVSVDAMGWKPFFWITMLVGIPGMVLLARFAPLGVREPEFSVEPPRRRQPLGAGGLVARGLVGAAVGLVAGTLLRAALGALKAMRGKPEVPFDLGASLQVLLHPQTPGEWVGPIGLLAFAVVCGLFVAAIAAARRGAIAELE
jgi:MFS transporter, PAT family, beta-lactamase induction signal transducer AmpG